MANPNNIYKSISKVWAQQRETVVNTLAEAEALKQELEIAFPKVTIKKFKTGPNLARYHSYVVRSYIKR